MITLLAAFFAGCESSPLSPLELLALERAEARWGARPFQDYAVEMRLSCFCPGSVAQWARVEVVAGQVNRVVVVATGEQVPATERVFFRTVEQVFHSIGTVAHDDWVEDVVVEFDSELGFPAYASFVSKPDILDAGITYYLQNAGPIP